MNILMSLEDVLELALHRALRGEVSPSVHAITADLGARPIRLNVYGSEESVFEEAVESEMQQCLPQGVDKSLAQVICTFHSQDEYEVSSEVCLLYLNYHTPEGQR